MQTDLRKILAVSGQHGLYVFVAQARNGVVAETLAEKKRTVLGASSRVTSLGDIAIYTDEGELKLEQVFTALKAALGEAEAPSSKGAESEIVALFSKAVPNYDADRFYLSHMRKILDWYAQIVKFASLDFVQDEEEQQGEEA